eukprot:gene12905-27224_t
MRSYDAQLQKILRSTGFSTTGFGRSKIEVLNTSQLLRMQEIFQETNLPSFSSDNTEVILGAVIERAFDNHQLYLTSFLLSHFMLSPVGINDAQKIRGDHIDLWKKILSKSDDVKYTDSGSRLLSPEFYCRITNSLGSDRYLVMAEFVPNRLTVDANSNRRLDIMRCKMLYSEQ